MQIYVFILDDVLIMIEAENYNQAVERLWHKDIIVNDENHLVLGDGVISAFYKSYAG